MGQTNTYLKHDLVGYWRITVGIHVITCKMWNGYWKTSPTQITTAVKRRGISQITLNQICCQYEDTHDNPKKGDSKCPPLSSEIYVHTIERTTIEKHFKNRTLNAILEQQRIIFLYLWTEMMHGHIHIYSKSTNTTVCCQGGLPERSHRYIKGCIGRSTQILRNCLGVSKNMMRCWESARDSELLTGIRR